MSREEYRPFAEAGPARPGGVRVMDIADLGETRSLTCDVLIVGGGPAGLTVARGLDGHRNDIVILESGGLGETPEAEALNEVIATTDTWSPAQAARRETYHAVLAEHWSHGRQGFGVRCRGLGGSTGAWAGKSAGFDAIDFARREWVPESGWPIAAEDLAAPLDRAAEILNLGPNCYDEDLWQRMRRACPEPRPDPARFRDFFWQLARSTINPMDVMRTGPEFLRDAPTPCRVMTGATVTEILTGPEARQVTGAVVADAGGIRRRIRARTIVLAASAIENARLLLASKADGPSGLGNRHDVVGRYLLDHPSARVGHFDDAAIARMAELYGFYGLRTAAGVKMYMRGLAPRPEVQRAEGLLNCAAYMPAERAPDDPWDAAKRIVKRDSENYLADGMSVFRSLGMIWKGAGRLALQHRRMPEPVSRFVINQVIRFRPNFAAEEYLTRGVPHKMSGLAIEAICEQVPERANRVRLSDTRSDRFGTPLPEVHWKVGDAEARTLTHFARMMADGFAAGGLPRPVLADWVERDRFDEAGVLDMGHTAGTTRTSDDPGRGVVDRNCQVHGVDGLFVAGASVFPTIGHANPTLMICALSVRLAEHLRAAGR